jgi:hypothetical protein
MRKRPLGGVVNMPDKEPHHDATIAVCAGGVWANPAGRYSLATHEDREQAIKNLSRAATTQ